MRAIRPENEDVSMGVPLRKGYSSSAGSRLAGGSSATAAMDGRGRGEKASGEMGTASQRADKSASQRAMRSAGLFFSRRVRRGERGEARLREGGGYATASLRGFREWIPANDRRLCRWLPECRSCCRGVPRCSAVRTARGRTESSRRVGARPERPCRCRA